MIPGKASQASTRVIVVGNEKGGSGKSTVAIHIAIALMKAGQSVATVDLDLRQRSLTRYIENQPTPGFYQTSVGKTRGDANTREFDLAVAQKLPCTFDKEYQEEQIWKTFTTFIRAVMPVAEKNKVRIGLHPDDPPVASLGCVARVFRTYAAYERAFQLADSDNFGVCLCIGTWAEGGKPAFGKDPVEAVRAFGAKKRIFKVHFRNVNSTLPRFRETFVDNGYLDMYQVMKALRDVKFDGIVVPDHVPGGGYPAVNNSYTIGYMKALRDRVNAEARRV